MPNGAIHQLAGAATAIGVSLMDKDSSNPYSVDPVTAAMLGGFFGKMPDMLEPAIHPNHRQFFHSFAVFGVMGYGLKKLYDWEPETNLQCFLRSAVLIGGTAYLSHLFLDSLTKKSLPMIGKL